ncbi:MAG TPA: phosphopantetheine-binding protein, partial [Blastocatellia bacterium]|nr:phosphopantetheine-binding protein [Blastocatellia bacterium]
SYTGTPFSADEMREWRDSTVERILSLGPNRMLEIGCGTGLLLFAIAPEVREYVATDFSPVSLEYIDRQVEQSTSLASVSLSQRMADDFSGFEPESFDLVVLNSVVQYFPDIDYLVRVLTGAVTLVRPGGHVFIGDVRSLPLLKALKSSVHLERAAAGDRISDIKRSIEKSVADEEELVLDPEFFYAMRNMIWGVTRVEVKLKRGRHDNELTRFRYDVVLELKKEDLTVSQSNEREQLDWRVDGLTLNKLSEVLASARGQVHIASVPNARVLRSVHAVELLAESDGGTARDLRELLEVPEEIGIDPEEICSLANKYGYDAEIYLPAAGEPECFNVALVEAGTTFDLPVLEGQALRPLRDYANNPLRKSLADKLGPQLRDDLASKLPDYMVPSSFVVMNSLPLAPNGKVDRRALPAPDAFSFEQISNFQPCRTATEKQLAKIWAEALGIQRVGIWDNFFDLGGHSLMVAQVASRVRDAFSIELPLAVVFERPTVAELGECVDGILRVQHSAQTMYESDEEIGEI